MLVEIKDVGKVWSYEGETHLRIKYILVFIKDIICIM